MDNNSNTLATAGKFIALIIGLFMLGNIIGSLTNITKINTLETVTPQGTTQTTTVATQPSTEQTTTAVTTTETTTQITTTQPTTVVTTTAVTTTANTVADSKKEIVELFNSSANKVKTKAKKVTRNYENLTHDERNSDYPVALKLAYNSLINSWIVHHDTPIVYTEKDIIIANFPVKGKDWSSKLKADYVDNATITEKDGKYHIVIDLADCVNPAENEGVCSVMEEVNLAKVQELVPIVKKCDTKYHDCKIECIIEKASGNMIYAKYTQPMTLALVAGRIRDMDATFAMTIESEFEIAY